MKPFNLPRRARAAISSAIALAAALCTISTHAAIPLAEREALLHLYNSTSGWIDQAGWGGARGTECSWYGITCTGAPGSEHVVEINLNYNGITGGAALSFSGLTELQNLELEGNSLSSGFPNLSGLTQLRMLDLRSNQFAGQIPSLAGLINLEQVVLNENQFTGSTPALTGMTKLRVFDADSNQLNGTIGALTGATALEKFFVRDNQLTGQLPDLSDLGNLRLFVTANNRLTGPIPDLTSLGKLLNLELENNQLTGPIPSSLSTLTGLSTLRIGNNKLTGSPPMPPNATRFAVMCPNSLRRSSDEAVNAAWDARTGNGTGPWNTGCTGSWDVAVTISGTGGSAEPTLQTIATGARATITAAPDPDRHLASVSGCGATFTRNTVTTAPVTHDCTVILAFAEGPPPPDPASGAQPVPTLGQWALALLATLMLLVGVRVRRRG